jgi:hypothetical protein
MSVGIAELPWRKVATASVTLRVSRRLLTVPHQLNNGVSMKLKVLGVALISSLALSACGASTSSSLNGYVASLGGSANLQVKLTADFSGASSAAASKILKELTFDMNYSSPDGGALSDSSGKANTEITASVKGKVLLDLRAIANNLYVNVNVDALGSLPGTNLSARQLASFQLLFGNRWFELPSSILKSALPTSTAAKAKSNEDRVVATKLIDQITQIIDNGKVTNLGHGTYSETGTILSIAKAMKSAVSSFAPVGTPTAANAKGTYKLTLSTSGSNATAASISITAPNGTKGNATGTLIATFTHNKVIVSAPANATVLSSKLLQSLLASRG